MVCRHGTDAINKTQVQTGIPLILSFCLHLEPSKNHWILNFYVHSVIKCLIYTYLPKVKDICDMVSPNSQNEF